MPVYSRFPLFLLAGLVAAGCATTGAGHADRPNCHAGADGFLACTVTTDDGVKLAYREYGDGPRNLLLMHGWGGAAENFDPMVKALDPHQFRAIAWDIRGHGDSDKTTQGFTDERFAKDALTVADDAKADKFEILGFSMSGRFVQYVQLLAPTRVLGQVLVAGCPAAALPLPDATIMDWANRAGDSAKLKEIPSMFATHPQPAYLDEYSQDAAKATKFALETTLRMLNSSFADKIQAEAQKPPTLVIAGANDKLLGPPAQQGTLALYPGTKMETLDTGHEILIEAPTQLAQLVTKFSADIH